MQTVEEHLNPRKRFSAACHLLVLTGLCILAAGTITVSHWLSPFFENRYVYHVPGHQKANPLSDLSDLQLRVGQAFLVVEVEAARFMPYLAPHVTSENEKIALE